MSNVDLRNERLQKLRDAARAYVKAEKDRIDQEVAILQAVLDGRTGGAGVQRFTVDVVSAVAQNDLAAYLLE
jgi:hypothetical protein